MDSEWHIRRDFIGDRDTWYPSCYCMHHYTITNAALLVEAIWTNAIIIYVENHMLATSIKHVLL